jgi:hypothetical protein
MLAKWEAIFLTDVVFMRLLPERIRVSHFWLRPTYLPHSSVVAHRPFYKHFIGLRRENKQLRLERDILSKAAAWFARETGTLPSSSSGS